MDTFIFLLFLVPFFSVQRCTEAAAWYYSYSLQGVHFVLGVQLLQVTSTV